MTALLQEVMTVMAGLSDAEQDFVAAPVLENIRDTRQWDAPSESASRSAEAT